MKTELELRHLRVFVAVVEAGAHTRAAKALGLSQSTVSETLSALERTLGAPVFARGAKALALTPAGDALLVHARRILASTSELLIDVAKVSAEVSGALAISAVESLSTYVLPAQLAASRERWPKVRFDVTTHACADIRASVASGKTDVGFVIEADTGVRDASTLAHVRLLIVTSPAHPLAGQTVTLAQLQRSEMYMSDAAGDYHDVLRRAFDGLQGPRTQSLGTIEGVKRSLLTSEHAMGLLPAHSVERELREGTIGEVRVTPVMGGLVVRAVVSPKEADSPVVADLCQRVRGAFGLSGLGG